MNSIYAVRFPQSMCLYTSTSRKSGTNDCDYREISTDITFELPLLHEELMKALKSSEVLAMSDACESL